MPRYVVEVELEAPNPMEAQAIVGAQFVATMARGLYVKAARPLEPDAAQEGET